MQNIIKELDLSFQSSVDYLRIFYDVYMDSQIIESSTDSQSLKSRIVVQIAHGMVEHKGRYEWVGMQLAQKGFVVVINDHRGHGKSIDSTHPWGEMKGKTQGLEYAENTMDTESLNKMQNDDLQNNAKISNAPQKDTQNLSGFMRAVADMHKLTTIIKARFKPTHYVLLGHSMGSLLARSYLKSYKHELDTLILSGSPAYNPLVGFGQALAQMLNVCRLEQWGKHLINNLSFGSFNKPFLHNEGEDNTKGGFAWLCRDKAVVEAYKADSACQFIFSLQSFIGLFEGMKYVNDMQDLKGEGLPLLVISGKSDSCGNFGVGVEKIAYQYQQCGFNMELILYEGARHEILNEINKEQVLSDIICFITKLSKK
ncbi:alpha/beta hydrolase [Helicobacter typhlonius]|uniref:alpha/beta hydrolase n=1 Tax=Helicobacter typhlonius TaxID=76936 RepID=UPI002FE2CC56